MLHGVIGYLQLVHIRVQRQCVMVCFQFHQWNDKVFHHTRNLQPETAKKLQFDGNITVRLSTEFSRIYIPSLLRQR